MKIAVMTDRINAEGIVPDTFETSPALIIWETDTGSVTSALEGGSPKEYIKAILDSGCEAVVCGEHITRESFEPIAAACVTRYNGAGLTVAVAAEKALWGRLELVRDYEGGVGCSSGSGSCEGDCAEH